MKKMLPMAVAGILSMVPALAAGEATSRPAKLTVTVHYEEVFHLVQGISSTESEHGTEDEKLVVDLSFERPIRIWKDGPQLDFPTVDGPVNMTGQAIHSASGNFADDSGNGSDTGQAVYKGGLDPDQGDLVSIEPSGNGLRIQIGASFTLKGKGEEKITSGDGPPIDPIAASGRPVGFGNRLLGGLDLEPEGDDGHPVETLDFAADVWPAGGDPDNSQSLADASDFGSQTWVGAAAHKTADGGWQLQYTGHKTQISPQDNPDQVHATRTLVVELTITPE